MKNTAFGTVSALKFCARPELDFVNIVEEFDIAFQMIDSPTRSLTWDCDDVAIFDREMVRVAFGWLAPSTPDGAYYLIVAVGPTPKPQETEPVPGYYEAFLGYIVERTNDFIPYDAVLNGDASCPVGTALIDTVSDLLRLSESATPDNLAPRHDDALTFGDDRTGAAAAAREARKQKIRKAETWEREWDVDGTPAGLIDSITLPKRLTIYTLSYSMILQIPAIGAFLLVYTILRDVFPAAA